MQQYAKEYRQSQVEKATDLEAVVLLYDEAILRLETAKRQFADHNPVYKDQIDYALKVIKGLALILDFKQGGTIAQNLYAIYNYMDKRLLVAREGIMATSRYLDEIIGLLTKLRDSWSVLANKEKEETAGQKDTKPVTGHIEVTI